MDLPHYPRKIKYRQNILKKHIFLSNRRDNLFNTLTQNMTED